MCVGSKPKEEKPGANEIEMVRQGLDKWDRYQSDFKPMENEFIERIRATGSDEAKQRSVNSSVNLARHSTGSVAPPPGMSPNSSNFRNGLVESTNITGRAVGQAAVAGEETAKNNYAQGVEQLVRLGRGLSGNADASLSHSASLEAGRIAEETAYSNANKASRQETIGGIVGAGGYAVGANQGWWGPNKKPQIAETKTLSVGTPMGNGQNYWDHA